MNTDLSRLAQSKLARAKVTLDLDEYDRKLLTKNRGAVFVCNQLLPGLDEWLMLALLGEHAETVKIVYPYPTPPPKVLKAIAIRPLRGKLTDRLLQVNFFKKIAKSVKKGEAVALPIDFSDNPLSHFGKNLLRQQILKQLRKAQQTIIPIHLQADHLPGGYLRKAIPGLPYQFTTEPVRINVRVGNAITPDDIASFSKTRLWGKFLQAKIFSLGSSFDVSPELFAQEKSERQQPIAAPVNPDMVAAEIEALPPTCKITSRGQFDVFVAPFSALPNTIFEVARLRELTFRAAGEGTGKPRDLDEYDLYYLQLLIWDRTERKIVGGYRLGQGDLIFRRFGVNGFYINSLFKIKKGFYPILQDAVELGRSYVTPEYQKHRLPLFLLWKGILHFLLANPQYRYLYGPVSISKDYSDASKAIIVEFVRRFFFDKKLAALVEPRKPFRANIKSVDTRLLAEQLRGEFDALESLVETIEPAHFKVPVLFRQYLRQNAKFIAFNVDPNFADCLDGLMILDIAQLPSSTIEALQQEK
ncbi:MAG: lysophospholipid acyltransferase family protein [Saprospiraceae bacterium]|nr:lysophospholipid acyltransferase family protein [Saprospiraceae bacterium]